MNTASTEYLDSKSMNKLVRQRFDSELAIILNLNFIMIVASMLHYNHGNYMANDNER